MRQLKVFVLCVLVCSALGQEMPVAWGESPTTNISSVIEAGKAGSWVDITPPVPRPWADPGSFHYGFGSIDGAKVDAPGTLYVGLDHHSEQYSGIWKTTDGGNSWAQVTQGPNGELRRNPHPVAVDPTNSNVLYAGSVKTGLGVFKSIDGGQTWTPKSIIPEGIEPDPYSISIDPNNHNHILLTFHSAGKNWASTGNAGVIESYDGGVTWPKIIQAGGWSGAGQFVFFVGKRNDGTPDVDGSHWIVATQHSGIFRTENAGASWTKVAAFNMTHGMEQMYRAPNDALYLGSVGSIYRSTDNGRTWNDTGAQKSPDGYGGIVGDGEYIWAMLSNTGTASAGPYHWQVLPINDTTSSAINSNWKFFGSTTYITGPFAMIYDPVNRIVYASSWGAGVFRYKVP